jgi:membrane fusion protein (multidrug efflux system)
MRPGMFARVRVLFAQRDNVVMVPEEALMPQGNKQYVFKVVPGANGPVSQRLEVNAGTRRDGKVEVQGAALAAGDMVVTAGQGRLRGESQALKLIELGKADAAPRAASAASPA